MINSDELHKAADIVGETNSPNNIGINGNALEDFISETIWNDGDLNLDRLSLAVGISIGVIAERNRIQ